MSSIKDFVKKQIIFIMYQNVQILLQLLANYLRVQLDILIYKFFMIKKVFNMIINKAMINLMKLNRFTRD